MSSFQIRPLNPVTDTWLCEFLTNQWGSSQIVTRGIIHDASRLPGFVAISSGKPTGLITYKILNNKCELVTLDSTVEGKGIGSALIKAVKQEAISAGCRRMWVITTNDNLHALSFYQKQGFHLVDIHRNAIDISRKLKPQIPKIGMDEIPIRDEIELEMLLD
ncbi:MAG: GNAT family N-acetyltransferase [Anaerolineales bacterium]|nr:GNAT family N-acetyltransferase [Anaerolineales bacterium]